MLSGRSSLGLGGTPYALEGGLPEYGPSPWHLMMFALYKDLPMTNYFGNNVLSCLKCKNVRVGDYPCCNIPPRMHFKAWLEVISRIMRGVSREEVPDRFPMINIEGIGGDVRCRDENGRAGGRFLNNFVYLCKNGKLNSTQQDSHNRHSPSPRFRFSLVHPLTQCQSNPRASQLH